MPQQVTTMAEDASSIELAIPEEIQPYISKPENDETPNPRSSSKESSWVLRTKKSTSVDDNRNVNMRPRGPSITLPSLPSIQFSTPSKMFPLVPLRNYLLFSGIEKPATWYSPWWISWFGWRLFVLTSLFASIQNIVGYHNKKQWLINFYLMPAAFATFTAGCSWFWLPGVLKGLENQVGPPIIDQDMSIAKKLFTVFFTINFLAALVLASLKVSVSVSFGLFGIIFLECAGATVILGGVLLVLTIETTLAKKEVRQLLESAQNGCLTREMYFEGVKSIQLRSKRWKHPLNSLAFVAFYCSICLVIIQTIIYEDGDIRSELFSNRDDDEISAIEIDLEIMIVLLKEMFLLFIIMYLIMGINDEADAITSELINHTWGPIGTPRDCARLDLLLITTTVAAPSKSLVSWYQYLTTPKTRPITFEVLNFRITRDYVLAAGASLLLAIANVVLQNIKK